MVFVFDEVFMDPNTIKIKLPTLILKCYGFVYFQPGPLDSGLCGDSIIFVAYHNRDGYKINAH